MRNDRVLFLGKADHDGSLAGCARLKKSFANVQEYYGRWNDAFPEEAADWQGDYIFSYLAPWVISEKLIQRARCASLNFHPGPPEYPGIGCTNFALYEGKKDFGITCHHMAAAVDSGPIVLVRRFPIAKSETVYSLTKKCHREISIAFDEIVGRLERDMPLPQADEHWTRKPYRRHELNELCRITTDMSAEEVRRRIRATAYPGAQGAYIEVQGYRFSFDGDPYTPIA